MVTFLLGLLVGGVLGTLAGGLFIFKRYRPALRALYEYLDTHAPRDQAKDLSRRLGQS